MSKLIEYTTDTILYDTIDLTADGLLRGVGSREVTITSYGDPIVKVESNLVNSSGGWDEHREINAVIENIILKGANGSETAIMLNDVFYCQIRNVAIENASIGIHLTTTTNNWMGTEATRIEHVRMNDVNMGIYFSRGDGTGNRGYTHIEDVGIALKSTAPIAGIGIDACKLSSPFIKANVWSTVNTTGMFFTNDSEMHTGIINFNHHRTSGPSGGSGIELKETAALANNHDFWYHEYDSEEEEWTSWMSSYGFFLASANITTPVYNAGENDEITHREY